MARLLATLHKVFREPREAFEKGRPGTLFGKKDNGVSHLLDQYSGPAKPILFGQPHCLTLAVSEQTCCLHISPPKYTLKVYTYNREMSIPQEGKFFKAWAVQGRFSNDSF